MSNQGMISRRAFLSKAGLAVAGLALRGASAGVKAPRRPNVLFIITDDQESSLIMSIHL